MTKPFKPLLAASTDGEDLSALPFPLLASFKLDGIRILMLDGANTKDGTYVPGVQPATRKILQLPNLKIRAALSRPELAGMDGEIISGEVTHPDVYNSTTRIVMKGEGPGVNESVWLYSDAKDKPQRSFTPVAGALQIDNSYFYVFDDFSDPSLGFQARFNKLKARVAALPADLAAIVRVVEHVLIEDEVQLANFERLAVDQGYEGIMLRSLNGPYKLGRSTFNEMTLAKVKRFADTDGIIVGFEEMMHNDNEKVRDHLGHGKRSSNADGLRPAGTLGCLVVQLDDFDGQVVRCGSGFTAAMKQEIWDNQGAWHGETVVLKYQPSGMKDLPRFPIFKGLRKD